MEIKGIYFGESPVPGLKGVITKKIAHSLTLRVQKRIFSSIQKLLFHSESAVSRATLNLLLHLFLRRSQQMLVEAFPMQLKDDEPREFHPRGEKRSKLPSK